MFTAIFSLLFNGGIVTKLAMLGLSIALVLSIGSCTVKQVELTSAQHQVTSLQKDVGQLTANTAILKQNQDTLKKTNDTNLQTIDKLVQERADSQKAIDQLATQKRVEHTKAMTAQARIDELLKSAKNNGPIAPVLSETLKEYN